MCSVVALKTWHGCGVKEQVETHSINHTRLENFKWSALRTKNLHCWTVLIPKTLAGQTATWGITVLDTTHTHTHTRAHARSICVTRFAMLGFFFFLSLFISWGHASPARTLLVAHRTAHAPKGNTCNDPPPRPHTHTLSPSLPTPTATSLRGVYGVQGFSRRAAPRIQVILPPSWLITLVSNHHSPSPAPLHPHRVAPQQGWEGQEGRERRGAGQTCSPPARQIYFQVPCI